MGAWDFLGHLKEMVKYDNGIVFSGSVGLVLIILSGILTALFSNSFFQQFIFGLIFILGIILIVYALYRYNSIDDYMNMKSSRNRKRKYRGLEYDLTTQQKKVS